MPGQDGTGPKGQGAGTGRGFGPCKVVKKKGHLGLGGGVGLGKGFGPRRVRGAGRLTPRKKN